MLRIRSATPEDAAALRAIYAPYVTQSAVSFEVEVPTVAAFAARIEKALERFTWLVAESEEGSLGYAYGAAHRERAAYRWSVETSVYLDAPHHRKGVGKRLYAVLLDELTRQGYGTALAGVTLPNPASVGLHLHMGFEVVGTFARVGRKFGQWHDVMWLQRPLAEQPPDAS